MDKTFRITFADKDITEDDVLQALRAYLPEAIVKLVYQTDPPKGSKWVSAKEILNRNPSLSIGE